MLAISSRGRGWLARLPLAACSRALNTAGAADEYYTLLGVRQGADQAQIKEAFRRKAKLLHPDAQSAHGRADQEEFVRLLTAYQVLSNPRSRELYDLSLDAKGHRILRKAAAAGVQGGAAGEEEEEIDISWGLSALFKQGAAEGAGRPNNMLDKLRSELQSDLHVALRHAYLGPKLDLEDAHQLPECFEADERSNPEAPELLELVSGRQLLGVVRERRAVQLAEQRNQRSSLAGAAAQQSGGFLAPASRGTDPAVAPLRAAGGAGQQRQEHQHVQDCGEGAQQAEPRAAAGSPQQPHSPERPADLDPGPAAEPGASASSAGNDSSGSGIAGQHGPGPGAGQGCSASAPAAAAAGTAGTAAGGASARSTEFIEEDPQVLELMMGEQLVATAVRRSQVGGTAQQSAGGGGHPHGPAGSFGTSKQQQQPQQQPELGSDAALLEVSFFRGERLLGTLQAEHETATSNSPSAARFLNADGVHTHTVLRSSSPLVRHLTIVAEPATGVAPARRSKAAVVRARRAWLPPSTVWLFRPRNYEHDIGGWYIEWVGHEQRSHPAWLDPAVAVLAAGFDTLDHERARHQPQGLFGRYGRLRAGDETAGGPLAWVRAMLRFHGVRK